MKIYTKTGDSGTTGLVGGSRVTKNSARINAIGTVDELNSAIGLCRVEVGTSSLAEPLGRVQHALFRLGAELATPQGARGKTAEVRDGDIAELEDSIDQQTALLPPLQAFILPGGCRLAAELHHARSVCRRTERIVLDFHEQEPVRTQVLVFLNRLSDWLFVSARTANQESGVNDIEWKNTEES